MTYRANLAGLAATVAAVLAFPVVASAQEGQAAPTAPTQSQPATVAQDSSTTPAPSPEATSAVSAAPSNAVAPATIPAPPESAAPSAAAPAISPEAAPVKAKEVEEILVTGSRIRRLDLTTPAPVTVIGREQIQASGKVSIGDFLQSLPEQGNAINTGVNNGGDGSTRVSLRSLGSARTLVLVNGRRLMPGGLGADSSPDLNSIPASAIERVEVLKDGASAVYGSDAIGGVINIITRKKWSGTEANVYVGGAGSVDGLTVDTSVTTGVSNEKGSLLLSLGYTRQDAVMASDRSFSNYQYFYDATGLNNGAGTVGQYAAGSSRTPGGRVKASGSGDAAWNALIKDTGAGSSDYMIHDSTMTPNAACVAAGGSADDCKWRVMNATNAQGKGGDLYNYAPMNYLVTPQQRLSSWVSGDYKLGDYSRAFFETSFVNRRSKQQLAPEPLIIGAGGVTDAGGNLIPISKDNLYNPFGKDFTSASRRLDEFGPRIDDQNINAFRLVLGLDGTLPSAFGPLESWVWDVNFNYGRTSGTSTHSGSLQSSRIAAAVGPSMMINGKPACVGTAGDPSTVIAGCVPLDLFHGSGSITPDQVAYLGYTGVSSGFNELMSAQLNTSGDLFRLFSRRAVSLAAGYEFRQVAGASQPDTLTARFDTTNPGGYPTDGRYHVSEGYAELLVPIMNAQPLVEDLEASLAARVFDYNNFGSDWTYKAGLRWTPIKDVTLRGTYSTAFRAPSISDLVRRPVFQLPQRPGPVRSPG